MALPNKGEAYVFYMGLVDSLDAEAFKVNPTIASGDFTVSKDGGAFTTLATLPVVSPAGSVSVKVSLSASEMDADKVNIHAKDLAGAEWFEALVDIDVPRGNVDTAVDILEGDHIENRTTLLINRKGTTTPVLSKKITGSLLPSGIQIETEDN
jgi:hypothetical protein